MMERHSTKDAGAVKALLVAATAGLFPVRTSRGGNPGSDTATSGSLTAARFEKRPYAIRQARPEDLPDLATLERECWLEALRSPSRDILARISAYPGGQLVVEMEGRVVGVVYSQRISCVESLRGAVHSSVFGLHTSGGPVVQLLAINVLPEVQHLGLGDQLLEFMLQCCELDPETERVVAVSLCRSYRHHAHLPLEDYIHRRDEAGKLIDPTLHFHEYHGATVRGLLPGYRAADIANLGNGVLVEYDPGSRCRGGKSRGAPRYGSMRFAESLGRDKPLRDLVERAVRSVLGPIRTSAFSFSCSFIISHYLKTYCFNFRKPSSKPIFSIFLCI